MSTDPAGSALSAGRHRRAAAAGLSRPRAAADIAGLLADLAGSPRGQVWGRPQACENSRETSALAQKEAG